MNNIIFKVRVLHLTLILIIFLSGCVKLPSSVPVSESERAAAETAFQEMLFMQQDCSCCLDADVTVTFKTAVQSGTLPGYLQVMAPSYLKFAGINPLGQPLLILNTDGKDFQYIAVPEAIEYKGHINAGQFEKYSPEGFSPEHSYYLLTGRFWPSLTEISNITRDPVSQAYWITLSWHEDSKQSLVLFDPHHKHMLRHLVLNRDRSILLDIQYDDYGSPGTPETAEKQSCLLPGTITIASGSHDQTLSLSLRDWSENVSFSEKDFQTEIPFGYRQVIVK